MPGYGWVPIDANAGHGKSPGERAGFFGGRSNRHVVTTLGGGASTLLEWSYNNHQTYGTQGGGKLEIQPIGRYRPLVSQNETPPAEAPRVLPPLLTAGEPGSVEPATRAGERDRGASPWLVGLALFVALGAGVGIGRVGLSPRR